MLAGRTGRHSLNKALAVVSPLAFADAVECYVTALPPDELRALVSRSIKRMDPSERVQFALFLGFEPSSNPIDEVFVGPSMRANDLDRLVESCSDFLPNRFAAFLRENRRAVPSLGTDTVARILATLPNAQFDESARPQEMGKRRFPAQAAIVVGLALLVALVPLIAQYAHQRGVLAGLSNASFAPVLPQFNRVAASTVPPKVHSHSGARHTAKKRIAHRRAASRPKIVRRTRHKHITYRPPARIAGIWKFDPQYNPYFSGRWHTARSRRRATARAQTTHTAFEDRARLAVSSYLDAVIAGNTGNALQHLGMPATGSPDAISESSIVSRDARARIVGVKAAENGEMRVQVDITGRRGEYFEIFSVVPDGPAVRISDRYYIPVNRTAEEVSARLLAKTH